MQLWRVVLPYACYGLLVNRAGIVSDAPPIARWMLGKPLSRVAPWIASKRGSLATVEAS